MHEEIIFTHKAILSNGCVVVFESRWPAHEVVGGLTHCAVNGAIEYHPVSCVIETKTELVAC